MSSDLKAAVSFLVLGPPTVLVGVSFLGLNLVHQGLDVQLCLGHLLLLKGSVASGCGENAQYTRKVRPRATAGNVYLTETK